MTIVRLSFAAATLALPLVAFACGTSSTCPPEDAGAPDALGDAPPLPADCDLAKSVKDSTACIDDAVGVFVAPSGDDGATGKKTAPVKSIAKGVDLATSRGLPRVYVCEGTYDAAAEIKAPVSIHGGFSCVWAYTGAKPKLAPPKGIALRLTKVNGAVSIEDLDVVGSADPNKPGDSAIAAFVSESANVTFRNVKLSAGAATAGAKGASRSNFNSATASKGGNASGANGGPGPMCTCLDGSSSTGGNGGAGAGGGLTDGTANPAVGTPNSGASKASSCDPGFVGADGASSGPGQPPVGDGALSSNGWSSELAAVVAPNGKPAQGGGGGGTKLDSSSPGGGGGCGGCGGAGGSSGSAGGSSIALLAFNSGPVAAAEEADPEATRSRSSFMGRSPPAPEPSLLREQRVRAVPGVEQVQDQATQAS